MEPTTWIIPVKGSSTRIPRKNFRPFAGELSLFDITARRVKAVAESRGEDVWVSSEDCLVESLARDRYGFRFHHRPEHLADNDTPLTQVMAEVSQHCLQGSGNDVAWCQVIQPFFDEHENVLQEYWVAAQYGIGPTGPPSGIAVVYPFREYILDSDMMPMGFGFGDYHVKSQDLPVRYRLPFCMMVLSAEAACSGQGYIPPGCLWYKSKGRCIDIDDMEQFEAAAALWQKISGTNIPVCD